MQTYPAEVCITCGDDGCSLVIKGPSGQALAADSLGGSDAAPFSRAQDVAISMGFDELAEAINDISAHQLRRVVEALIVAREDAGA